MPRTQLCRTIILTAITLFSLAACSRESPAPPPVVPPALDAASPAANGLQANEATASADPTAIDPPRTAIEPPATTTTPATATSTATPVSQPPVRDASTATPPAEGAIAAEPVKVGDFGDSIAEVSVGGDHICVLTYVGAVACWGRNDQGQLGNNSNVASAQPFPVDLEDIPMHSISASEGFTCGITQTGRALCWGANEYGQLGDGTFTNRLAPVEVSQIANTAFALVTGYRHACVLDFNGAIYCWGDNEFGQLGSADVPASDLPLPVPGLDSGVLKIAAGGYHTCAITDIGSVVCWGRNNAGQLGDNTTQDSANPVDVVDMGGGVEDIGAGESHTCARMGWGAVMCWGANDAGQLGDGTTTDRPYPVEVRGLLVEGLAPDGETAGNFYVAGDLTGGSKHTCYSDSLFSIKCWGDNTYGQLGDGTLTSRSNADWASGPPLAVRVSARFYTTCIAASGVRCWGDANSWQMTVADQQNGELTALPMPTPSNTGTVEIPAGEYKQGCNPRDANCQSNEGAFHPVTLDAFRIDQYEVTNARYSQCLQAGVCTDAYSSDSAANLTDPTQSEYPVTGVMYEQANDFCRWAGGQLPTEAQWEAAARGMASSVFPWGSDELGCRDANVGEDSLGNQCLVGGAMAVGSFPKDASSWGVMDVVGNVSEWVHDYWIRGGAFNSDISEYRVSATYDAVDSVSYGTWIGFRCAYPAEEEPTSDATPGSEEAIVPDDAPHSLTVPLAEDRINVPTGSFKMECYSNLPWCRDKALAASVSGVNIGAFQIDKYEVSNANYASCVEAGSCTPPHSTLFTFDYGDGFEYYGVPEFASHPVVNVDWFQAQAYCASMGGWLPSESQWIKAARGDDDDRPYPWGSLLDECAYANIALASNGEKCSLDTTVATGSFPEGASPYGAMDMIGNVNEWLSDTDLDDLNAQPTGDIEQRLLHGGSAGEQWDEVTIDTRFFAKASDWGAWAGFRCAYPSTP